MSKVTTIGLEEFLEENVKELTGSMSWMKDRDMRLCESIEELKKFVDISIEKGLCALDTETTGLNTRTDRNGRPYIKIVGICLAHTVMGGIYVPMNHVEGSEYNLPEKAVLEEIKRLCSNVVIVMHHSKYDLNVLKNEGIVVDQFDRFEDTMILAKLMDAGSKEIGLKEQSKMQLNQVMIEFSEITGGSKTIALISPKICYVYAASDAVCTLGLFEFFMKQEIVQEQKAIYNLEKRLVPVILQMEANLILIDKEYLQSEKIRISQKIQEIKKEVLTLAGEDFNIGSTSQLGKILFDKLKFRYPEKQKTESGQYKTDTSTLEKIAGEYPIVKKIIKYREFEKSSGTYIENLINNCDENSCIKLSFNQTGTDTGRFSSPGGKGLHIDGYCGVNIQSIPSNYDPEAPDIRKAFKARPGKQYVAIDFSGEELRVAANLSGEKKWVDEFLYGTADLHTATGKAIYKKEELTKLERGLGKTCNFLVLYGGGPRGLAEQTKVSENEARRILTSFFEGLPQLDKWIKKERAIARKIKMARTDFGRVRPLHKFYDSGDKGNEAHADRCATNFKIQGCCADIMKTAMVRVSSWIKSNNLQDEVKMLITMHDELVFEISTDKLMEYIPILTNIMCLSDILQGILKWPVPFTVDAEYGDTWHVDKNFFEEHPELKESLPTITFNSPTQVSVPTNLPEKVERVTEPLNPASEEPL